MQKINILLIGLGLLIITNSFSQENYLPGYIVKKDGKTIDGLIDYRNWKRNPGNITFKDNSTSALKILTPNDIKSFGVSDKIYESAVIEIEVSPNKDAALDFDPKLNIEVDTAFLQTMIKGPKSLYYYNDKNRKEHFYIKIDDKYELLIYKRHLTMYEGSSHILENKKFIGQLNVYLKDCPSIISKTSKTKYTKTSLEDIFIDYYSCINTKIEYIYHTPGAKSEAGFIAGMTNSTLEFTGEYYPYLTNVDLSSSLCFSAGAFYDILFPGNRKSKWSFNNELLFTSYKIDGKYIMIDNQDKHMYINTEFKLSYLKMNNMIRYRFPVNDWFIYVNAGITSGLLISNKNKRVIESRINSVIRVVEDHCLYDTKDIELGYSLGLGIKYKKFSVEARYEKGNGMSGIHNLKASTTRYHFFLGYTIK